MRPPRRATNRNESEAGVGIDRRHLPRRETVSTSRPDLRFVPDLPFVIGPSVSSCGGCWNEGGIKRRTTTQCRDWARDRRGPVRRVSQSDK
jgi:hypothetical protein